MTIDQPIKPYENDIPSESWAILPFDESSPRNGSGFPKGSKGSVEGDSGPNKDRLENALN